MPDQLEQIVNTLAGLDPDFRRPCAEDLEAIRASVAAAVGLGMTAPQARSLSRLWPPRQQAA